MRYEDASHTGAFQGSEPDARNDADAVPAGAHTPATGNVITGEGTQTGPSGSDTAAGAHITSIAGAGGEDSSFAGGKLAVSGEFGRLSIDAEGNYSYQAKEGAPENSRDRFTYTLADNQGNADTATLTIEIGKTPAVIKAGAQQVVVGPDGVVVLPAGVELSDIHIVGRNLVVDLPDGGQMVILDGAVFVPQLVLGGVEVPATNLAALLIGQEIAPGEGGPPQSSGGNFEVPVGPLDPGVPLGDLIPPTEYGYTPPEVKEVFDLIDEEPEIFFQPEDQAPSVAASDTVSELGLPERGDFEPAGTGEIGDGDGSNDSDHSEFTTGVIVYDSPDGVDSITISVGGNELVITGASVGDTINGQWGQLTITSVAPGAIGYEYRLADNTPGNDTHDDFLVTLVDNDGDVATATLTIDIIDDTPTARPDTDFIAAGDYGPVTGNVITDDDAGDHDVSGTDSDTDDGADTVGADDASLTSVTGAGATETTEGGWIVQGQYGVLTIGEDGSYSYTRNPGTPGGVNDVFNYTLTDGDGDVSSTTLTITIEDAHITVGENPDVLTDDDAVPLAGGNAGGPGDNVDADNLTGTLSGSGGDGPLTFDLQTTGAPDGFSYADGPDGSVLVQQVQNGVTVTVLTITLNASTGAYEVTQNAPILHDPTNPGAGEGEEGNFENNVEFNISYTVSDQDDDVETGTLTINVDDDTPEVTENQLGGIVDEDGLDGGNLGGVNDVPGADVTANGDVSELFSPGADQPLTFSLLTDTSSLRQDLTSNGVPVTYAVEGNTLTAMAGDTPVFTFVLNAETGEYTFTLLDQLDHPSLDGETGDDTENPTDQDLTIALGSIIQATDADGDSVTAPGNGLVITVDDDSPLPFEECPDDVIAVNDAGSSFTGDLNLPPVGADEPGTVSFLVDDGTAVLDTEGHPVSSNGVPLVYFVNEDGVLEAHAGDENGDVIFTITINGDGTFTYDQIGDITSTTTLNITDLDSVGGGNVEAKAIDVPDQPFDLILSTQPGKTVNTNSTEMGVGGGQSLSAGDDIRVDLVQNAFVTGSGGGAVLNFGEYYTANGYRQDVSGLNPAQTADFIVRAIAVVEAGGSNPADPADGDNTFYGDTNDTVVAGTTLNLYDDAGNLVDPADYAGLGIGVTAAAGGGWQITGLPDNYDFEILSDTAFNAVQVEAIAGTDTFKLGFIDITTTVQTDVDMSVPIALTDSDGDSVTCDIDINLGPPTNTPDLTLIVDEAALNLVGSDPGSTDESQSGELSDIVSGGVGPYTFALGDGGGTGTHGTLTIDENGHYVYTLTSPVDSQPDANDGTNTESGVESFTYVATDSEGNEFEGTITVNVVDDVPSIDVTGNDTIGNKVLTQDADTIGVATDSATSTTAFNGAFAIASAVAGADGVSAVNPGPDSSYALSLAAGYSEGSVTTMLSHGVAIRLYVDANGVITGSTATSEGLISDANRIFTISVSNAAGHEGEVTLTQYQQVDHPLQGGLNDAPFADQELLLPDNLVRLTFSATLQDGDGDIASDSAFIDLGGNVGFQDHGPVANDDVDALAPGNVGIADGNVLTGVGGSDTFGPDGVADTVGADAPGRITQISVTISGSTTTLGIADGGSQVINGEFGQLTIFSNGNYSYDRFDDSPGGGSDVFTYTLTDFDGDTDTATLTINIGVNPPVATAATAKVDDDGLANANPAGTDDINANDGSETGAGVGNEKIYTGSLAASVTGGDGDVDFRLVEPADGAAIGQETVNYSLTDVAGVQTLTATIATSPGAGRVGTVLFTVVLDKESGAYTVDLKDNVLHGDDANNNEDGIEVTAGIGFIATDAGSTDSNQATLTIQFNDDVPTAVADGPVVQPTENVAFTIDALANDVFGADGVNISDATKVVIVSNATQGVVTYDTTTHLFTYTPNAGAGSTGTSDSFTYKIIDADGDESTATVNITLKPDSVPVAADGVAQVDDDGLAVGVGNSDSPGDLDANAVPPEVAPVTTEAAFHGQLGATSGGDTIANYSFASMDGGSGSVGTETVNYSWNNATSTLTATGPRGPLFQVVVNQATGEYTLTLLDNVLHTDEVANQENDATANLTFTVTDSDGDPDTGTIAVTFDDDMPVVTSVTDPLNIANTGTTPSGTGDFEFDIGADQNANNDDISVSGFTIKVNNVNATNVVLTPGSENATTANYGFTFDYPNGDGTTAHGTGTLVFDKGAGTYTVELTSGPIEGFSVESVQGGEDPVFYTGGVVTTGSGEVAVAEIADDFFIQFTGRSGVTGSNGTFGNDEIFNGGSTEDVKISSTAIGVHGNSVQDADVLDYNFYESDPGGTPGTDPTTSAKTAFIQITQFNPNGGGGEDFVVVLKLADPDTPGDFITRTIIVNSADVITTNVPGYPALGSGGGLIIIEPSDYIGIAGVPDDYEIVGMQLRSSIEGLASENNEVYNFNGALGVGDGSATNFAASDTDNEVFKIIDIGVVHENSEDQSATIEFDVTVTDADGDQVVTNDVTVNIGDPVAPLAAVALMGDQEQQLQKTAANSNTTLLAAAIAASGFVGTQAAAAPGNSGEHGHQMDLQTSNFASKAANLADSGDDARVTLSNETKVAANDEVQTLSSSQGHTEAAQSVHGLDNAAAHMPAQLSAFFAAADQGPAANAAAAGPVAPAVAMVSAEALQAAGLDGSAKHGGEVDKVLADALGHGGPPTVDGLLQALGGQAGGQLAAISHVASPAADAVPAWDMGGHGAFVPGADMMFKMGAEMLHHDAVQPVANG